MIVPLFVGREKSVRALEVVMQEDRQILLAAQKDAGEDEPGPGDIHDIGVVANVLQLLKLPDGTVKVLVEGARRARILAFTGEDAAEISRRPRSRSTMLFGDQAGLRALARTVAAEFEKYVKLNKGVPSRRRWSRSIRLKSRRSWRTRSPAISR